MFTLKSKSNRAFTRFERDGSRSNDLLFQTKSACLHVKMYIAIRIENSVAHRGILNRSKDCVHVKRVKGLVSKETVGARRWGSKT